MIELDNEYIKQQITYKRDKKSKPVTSHVFTSEEREVLTEILNGDIDKKLKKWQLEFLKNIRIQMLLNRMNKTDVSRYKATETDHVQAGTYIAETTFNGFFDITKKARFSQIKLENLLLLCDCFECTPNELLGFENKKISDVDIANEIGLSPKTVALLRSNNRTKMLPDYKECLYRDVDENGEYIQVVFPYKEKDNKIKHKTLKDVIALYKDMDIVVPEKPEEHYFDIIDALVTYKNGEILNAIADYIDGVEYSIHSVKSKNRSQLLEKDDLHFRIDRSELTRSAMIRSLDELKYYCERMKNDEMWEEDTFYDVYRESGDVCNLNENELFSVLKAMEIEKYDSEWTPLVNEYLEIFDKHYIKDIVDNKEDPFGGRLIGDLDIHLKHIKSKTYSRCSLLKNTERIKIHKAQQKLKRRRNK